MKPNKSIAYILTSAIALVLLLAVKGATALTNPAPARAVASALPELPAQTALTSTTVASPASAAGEAIRDIRQPRHLPAMGLWILVAVGVVTSLGALVFWRLLRQAPVIEQSAQELALERLEEARLFTDPAHAREYCFAVSQIIRSYVEEQLSLRAPRLTNDEFLRELVKGQHNILGTQRGLLGDFLGHYDLAKFAGWRYSLKYLTDMHADAVAFVQQSAAFPATTTTTATNLASPRVPEHPLAAKEYTLTTPARNRL